MTTWILTIGDSDALLASDAHWNTLARQAKSKGCNLPHLMKSEVIAPAGKKLFSYPARGLGLVYADQLEVHGSSLQFPRLDALIQRLSQCQTQPQHIVILLTDQSNLFGESDRKPISPYWRDTCELKPLLEFHLKQALPYATQEYCLVAPEAGQPGLDHWESTLLLIQTLLSQVKCADKKPVYVSHQAGTPALSSAVQFATLTQFGSQVQFLVSSELENIEPELIHASTYLFGIRLQEAKRLLSRYDYAGVQNILRQDLKVLDSLTKEKIENLLNSAILWNQANFNEFFKALPNEKSEGIQYWQTGYEAAFLSSIRLDQGNTVEAMFHSFRAVEGLLSNWAKKHYPDDVKASNGGAPKAIFREGSKLSDFLQKEFKDNKQEPIYLYGNKLFELHQKSNPEASGNEDIKAVRGNASKIRNQQFHRLLGLTEKEVFRAWGTKENRTAWETRLLNCLNFVSGQRFESIKEASLMAPIHQELDAALKKCYGEVCRPELM